MGFLAFTPICFASFGIGAARQDLRSSAFRERVWFSAKLQLARWSFPSSRIPMIFVQLLGDHLAIRPGRRHLPDKLFDLLGEFPLSLGRQDLAGLPPPPRYRLSRLDQTLLGRLRVESSLEEFSANLSHPRPNKPGFAALLGSVYSI
jgi:hypothetical protein